MANSNSTGLEDMVKETYFCDFGHKEIRRVAEELRKSRDDHTELAKSIFGFVRDQIVFGFDPWQVRASDTLQKGYGMCSNKALLMVALLRYHRIPARLASLAIKREFLRPAWGPWCLLMPRTLNHVIAQVCLEGQWNSVDLTLDKATYERLYLPSGISWGIDWNKGTDCLVFEDKIAGPVEPYYDIDEALRANAGNPLPPEFMVRPFFTFINKRMWKEAGIDKS
jgi:transglutaminase-like putative cysteine protease